MPDEAWDCCLLWLLLLTYFVWVATDASWARGLNSIVTIDLDIVSLSCSRMFITTLEERRRSILI